MHDYLLRAIARTPGGDAVDAADGRMGSRTGMSSHQSHAAQTTTWLTPPFVLNALGTFDLDPCAAPDPKPWPTATEHYTWPAQNGLELPWYGRVYCNPPYGAELAAWMRRMAGHGRGVALIFARTETDAFFASVWERASALLFLKGRLVFHNQDGTIIRPDGKKNGNGGAPSVLCAYGPDDAERLYESGLEGAFVPLARPVMIQIALLRNEPMPAWREVVRDAVAAMGGTAKLAELYERLETHPKVAGNPNWRAKIRQTVARIGLNRIDQGQYALAI